MHQKYIKFNYFNNCTLYYNRIKKIRFSNIIYLRISFDKDLVVIMLFELSMAIASSQKSNVEWHRSILYSEKYHIKFYYV